MGMLLRCSSFGAFKFAISAITKGSRTKPAIISTIYTATNSGGNPLRHWDNETPPGGLTEVYVYKPDSKTVWPDDKLGQAFSQIDPRCCLPGNIGPADIFHARPLPSSNTASKLKPTSQFKQDIFSDMKVASMEKNTPNSV